MNVADMTTPQLQAAWQDLQWALDGGAYEGDEARDARLRQIAVERELTRRDAPIVPECHVEGGAVPGEDLVVGGSKT